MPDQNLMILWQRFHALEVNHPKFYTRCWQLVKTLYMVKGEQDVVNELDRMYFDYPPFGVPVSYIEDAFYASIGGSMATKININGHEATVVDLNVHLNMFYSFLLYLMTTALFETAPDYGIDFSGQSLQPVLKKELKAK
jgi:hypothetical protein